MSDLLRYITEHEDAFKSKARLTSLYSDFSRLKTTNPDGYRANTSAWISALARASLAGVDAAAFDGLLSIRAGEQLEKELEMKSLGRPVALGAVLDEAVKDREMIPMNDFLISPGSIHQDSSWFNQMQIPTLWQIAQWSLRQVGFGSNTTSRKGALVVRSNLEAASQAVLKSLESTVNTTVPSTQVYSLQTFTTAFSTVLSSAHLLSTNDIAILLQYLHKGLHACSISYPTTHPPSQTTITIKFSLPSSHSTSTPPLTSVDTTLAHLLTLTLALQTQIAELTARSTSLSAQIAALLPASHSNASAKTQALALLRRRRAATATLEKRHATLLQIEGCVAGIDEAAGQVEVVRAMEASGRVLGELNRQVGGAERVEGVLEALREEMATVEEVGDVIAADGGVGAVDDAEVEEELERMVEEGRHGQEEEGKVAEQSGAMIGSMPDVPTIAPGQSVTGGKAEDEMGKRLSLLNLEEAPQAVPDTSAREMNEKQKDGFAEQQQA